MQVYPISANPQEYLRRDERVDFDDPAVRRTAERLASGSASTLEYIRAAFVLVRDEIAHSADISSRIVTKTASEVLAKREGICYAKSMLLAALLRAAGIPAGFCYQRLTLLDTPDSGYCIHALNAVYIEELSAWTRLDARGNTNGKNAQFYPENPLLEQLAFPIRAEYGECEYAGIYAAHPACVIKPLDECTDCAYMLRHCLPERLE
ncbi:MAG: transglutaminase family protein [Oscillospiraceae bacterium]|jgi:transglutaminase-like putative cysteine protease|nr:transglutaminase family protein [Oscillospiraceae bacterium]